MAPRFQAPKGTFDVLPPESERYERLVATFADHVRLAGYGFVVGPMFEDVAVYERVGDSTDIVRKEMYDFEDKGGRRVALRPDSTPSVVRAFVEHRPPVPWKVWYAGPHFRYDRPARGRYRQHHQVGIECLGVDDADLDVEVVTLAWSFVRRLGVERVELLVNSMGDPACRPAYREALLAHLGAREAGICDEHRERYRANPMRLFDCKRPGCREVTDDAPRLAEHLCAGCEGHFDRVRRGLDDGGVPHTVDGRLVRGQDYYTRTAFELAGLALEAAQNGLGGGGRYDGLVEATGGPATPGIGFGLGVERLLDAADAEGVLPVDERRLDVFVVDLVGDPAVVRALQTLRSAGMRADKGWGGRSLKAQMTLADRSGARVAVIVGPDELAAGQATVRDMETRDQEAVALDDLATAVGKRL